MILTCIRSLPEAYSETLILRLVEGMTGPEIASRTGMTPGSVRVNLHRGMQQLREKLSETSRSGATQSASSAETKYTAARNRNALRRRKEP
jgi:RNA polymerase sigma-70 factor, ECF subfamily